MRVYSKVVELRWRGDWCCLALAVGGVRAHLRAEVSAALEDRAGVARPDISNENLIINELIREYLVFNRQGKYGGPTQHREGMCLWTQSPPAHLFPSATYTETLPVQR